ncbi:hypothetical protein SPFM8_00002 [Salmonella phage SPFM8]|nr:hypothetical protein SPFM8_00002 [Salmonella phage SPFM8]
MHYQTYDLNIFGEPGLWIKPGYVAVWEFLQRMGVHVPAKISNFLDIGSGFDSGLMFITRELTKGLVALTQDGVSSFDSSLGIYGQITIVDLCNFIDNHRDYPLGDYGNTSEILAVAAVLRHDQRLIDLCDTSIITAMMDHKPPMFTAPTVQVGQGLNLVVRWKSF